MTKYPKIKDDDFYLPNTIKRVPLFEKTGKDYFIQDNNFI